METNIDTKTPYNELDNELKSKLNPQLKESIDKFFKIGTNSEEGYHIVLEEEDPEYVEKMLNKPLESEFSVEHTLDSFKQKVINIYHKVLKRSPNNIELMHHSNMLRFEVSTEEEIENILKNSNDYKKLCTQHTVEHPAQNTPQPHVLHILPATQYPDEYHINIIKRVYDEELKREADEGGLASYLKKMKYEGMTEEKLRRALRNSPEYRQNFGLYTDTQQINVSQQPTYQQTTTTAPAPIPAGIASNIIHFQFPHTLIYCMMGENRLNEIKPYIETVLSYIDKFIYVDGGSNDGTIEYLNSLDKNKVEVYIHQWQDRFSEQRNHYLEKLKEQNYNGWIISSDTDEHYPIESLKQIQDIIPELEAKGYNGIKVQVEDIEVDDNNFNKVISRNVNQYWKPLIFKFHPNIRYEGEPHETLTGYPIKWYKSSIIYEHRRSKLHILQRGTENFFISNSNRWSEKWSDFRFLCTKNGILNFKDYWKIFKDHNLPKELEDWIYTHKDDNTDSGDSEVREMAQLYESYKPKPQEQKQPKIQPQPQLPEKVRTIINDAISEAFATDSVYEVIPPNNIYVIRIYTNKGMAEVIENRNGEAIFRLIKLQE